MAEFELSCTVKVLGKKSSLGQKSHGKNTGISSWAKHDGGITEAPGRHQGGTKEAPRRRQVTNFASSSAPRHTLFKEEN